MQDHLGNYHALTGLQNAEASFPLSFLSQQEMTPVCWQNTAKKKLNELLAFAPPPCSLDARCEEQFLHDELLFERVSYAMPYGPRAQALILRPNTASKPLPAVLALHDHSIFFYFGKEKIVDLPGEHPLMKQHKQKYYQGAGWANRLAKRGYVVMVPDVFAWGSRRLDADTVPFPSAASLQELEPGSNAYIGMYNRLMGEYESTLAKTLFLKGTTWPGIMRYDDSRALDYLLSREDVDESRVGCGGLSGGGLRSIFLAALDDRIRCSFIAGFMSGLTQAAKYDTAKHTWMLYLPYLTQYLDLPDVASVGGKPVMTLYGKEDSLWSPEGQRGAHERLTAVYRALGIPEQYCGTFYEGGHQFNLNMQNDAFDWFDRWLH